MKSVQLFLMVCSWLLYTSEGGEWP